MKSHKSDGVAARQSITVWRLFKQVLWGIFLRGRDYPGFWPKAWIPIFWASLTLAVMLFYFSHKDSVDFSTPYPQLDELHVDSGMLSEVKVARQFYFQLQRADGSTIYFRTDSAILRVVRMDWLYDDAGNKTPRPATISWFVLPSGLGWIAEIELMGEKLSAYEQRRRDYYDRARSVGLRNAAFVFFLICIVILVLEVFEATKYLKKGEING
jgi:hypothetical protein